MTGNDGRQSSRARRRLWALSGVVAVAGCLGAALAGVTIAAGSAATPIKIGILSTCQGPFAPFYPETTAGARTALIQLAGGQPAGTSATSAVTGSQIGGHPIQLVFGCSNAQPDVALKEARRLVEQTKVDILLGPLSGDEGIAIANYSKKRPNTTFVNGTSAAQDTTLHVRSPNFFRFTTDGAQWMAGLGAYAYNTLGWKNAVVIGDDYSFPYTQAAGFVAEFCAVGGNIVKRIWPPLGTKDYSGFITQIPRTGVDGFMLAVGGTGTVAFVKDFEGLAGNVSKKMVGGSVTIDPTAISALGDRLTGVVAGEPIPPDSTSAAWLKYANAVKKYYPKVSPNSLFTAGYYDEMTGIVLGLKAVGGDLSDGGKKFRTALAKVSWNSEHGPVKLDANRNAIADNFVVQVTKGGGFRTLKDVHGVDQTFGGHFSATTPTVGRNTPACTHGNAPPWAKG
jgi:branched-chain amino acid transport system substrate-binding protein